jgi:hypothetical protein
MLGLARARRGTCALYAVHLAEASVWLQQQAHRCTGPMILWDLTPAHLHATHSCLRTCRRGTLAGHLASEAQRQHPGKVAVHYGRCLLRLDLAARKAVFVASSSSCGSSSAHAEEEVVYDLLIGADGVSSRWAALLRGLHGRAT